MKEKEDFIKRDQKIFEYNYIFSSLKDLSYGNYNDNDEIYEDILFSKEIFCLLGDNKEYDSSIYKNFANTKNSYKEKISNEDLYIKEETLNKIYFNKKEIVPELYTFDKIQKEIFPKINIPKEIKEKIIQSKNITKIENNMSNKDRNLSDKKKKKKNWKN